MSLQEESTRRADDGTEMESEKCGASVSRTVDVYLCLQAGALRAVVTAIVSRHPLRLWVTSCKQNAPWRPYVMIGVNIPGFYQYHHAVIRYD